MNLGVKIKAKSSVTIKKIGSEYELNFEDGAVGFWFYLDRQGLEGLKDAIEEALDE